MSDTLYGAIIGAVAAIFGGIAGQLLTHVLSKRTALLSEKKEAYEAVEKLLFDVVFIDNDLTNFQLGEEFRNQFNIATTKLALYAPNEIVELFSTVYTQIRMGCEDEINASQIEDNAQNLLKAMRKDLGVKYK